MLGFQQDTSLFSKLLKEGKVLFDFQNTFVVEDINPKDTHHWLIIPKKEYANLNDISDQAFYELYTTYKILKNHYNINSFSLEQNNLRNQMIMHCHIHMIINENIKLFDKSNLFPQIIYTDSIPGLIFDEKSKHKIYEIKKYNQGLDKKFQIFAPNITYAKKLWKISYLQHTICNLWYTGKITLVINDIGIKFLSHPTFNSFMLSNPEIILYGTSLNETGQPYIKNSEELKYYAEKYDLVFDERFYHCNNYYKYEDFSKLNNNLFFSNNNENFSPSDIIKLEENNIYIDLSRNISNKNHNNFDTIEYEDKPYFY